MNWDKPKQLRHAAQCSWRFLRNGQRENILDLRKRLELLGYTGMVASLSAEDIISGWKKEGWVKFSPNGSEFRLTEEGIEQFAQWEQEDALWKQGSAGEIKVAKRLKAGEPVTNLRKIAQVIGKGILVCVFDPYTDERTLETLLKLNGIGVNISKNFRLLRKPIAGVAAQSLASFLGDVNTQMNSQWELRTIAKHHRRFLILQDGSVIICGLSLNDIDKDEVLDQIPMGDERADYDRKFFDNCWTSATPM